MTNRIVTWLDVAVTVEAMKLVFSSRRPREIRPFMH